MSCVEDAFDARTKPADFFSILSERDGGGDSHAWTSDDVVDGDQLDDRGNLSWGARAATLEGRAGGFISRGESRIGWRADGPYPCRSIHYKGSHDGFPSERPEHTVMRDAFSIDRYEVTLSLNRKFLEEAKHKSPPTWDEEEATSVGDRPAVGMRGDLVTAYCRWAGKRLSTEAE